MPGPHLKTKNDVGSSRRQTSLPVAASTVIRPSVLKYKYTRSESAAGVVLAWLFVLWISASDPVGQSRRHSSRPVAMSNANRLTISSAVIALAKTRPAATTGLPMPSPSLAVQRTFLVVENVVGSGWRDAEIPEQLGPRNWGQSSAKAPLTPRLTLSATPTSAIRRSPARVNNSFSAG